LTDNAKPAQQMKDSTVEAVSASQDISKSMESVVLAILDQHTMEETVSATTVSMETETRVSLAILAAASAPGLLPTNAHHALT